MATKQTADLVALIEAAGRSGVTSFKLGDFEVSFVAPTPIVALSAPLDGDMDQEVDALDDENVKEQRMAELMISDPLRYEQMLASEGVGTHEMGTTSEA